MLNQDEKKELFQALQTLAILKVGKMDKQRLMAYTEVLSKFALPRLLGAIKICMEEIKFFPDVSEIIKMVDPRPDTEDQAQSMCDNIVKAVLRYGRYQQDEIEKSLSEDERNALMKIGGPLTILDSMKNDMPMIRSQIRRSCKALLSIEKSNNHNERIASNENNLISEVSN